MQDIASIARTAVEALNARDFAALSAMADEDVAVSGIGSGLDNGREALRERLARHFQVSDESYGDALVLAAADGATAAVRLTARGKAPGGAAYSQEKILLIEVEDGRIVRIAFFSADGPLNGG